MYAAKKIFISLIGKAFGILCHIKEMTAPSYYSAARQNKWLTGTMSNSSSGWTLSVSSVCSLATDIADLITVFTQESFAHYLNW